jgi:hypothetical protein
MRRRYFIILESGLKPLKFYAERGPKGPLFHVAEVL